MNILIFKTSVTQPRQVNRVQSLLTAMPSVADWNFDLEDCDNILRVVSADLSPRYIERTLRKAGIGCEELEY